MSALAKPMIYSTNTTNLTNGFSPMVNAERVTSIDVVNIPQSGSNSAGPTFELKFTMAQDLKTGIVPVVTWKFVDDTALNLAHTEVVALIATEI